MMTCQVCGHREDMHPGHGPCRFHTCDCSRFESSRYIGPVPPSPLSQPT